MSASSQEPANWVLLAVLLRPQGRRGELLADCFTDFPESLAGRHGLFLAPPDFTGTEAEANPCTILAAWLPKGRNEGRVVLEIGAVTTIPDAEALAGLELIVRADHRQTLAEDSTYISDLVGCTLFDGDRPVGIVRDLHFPTTSDGNRRLENAAPLLVVQAGQDQSDADAGGLLVPFVSDYIDRIDTAARQLHMHLPAGLLDIQRTPATTASHVSGEDEPHRS